jgi:hypothetical protein
VWGDKPFKNTNVVARNVPYSLGMRYMLKFVLDKKCVAYEGQSLLGITPSAIGLLLVFKRKFYFLA